MQRCGYKLASKFCKLLRNVWHASIELHVNLLLAVMTKTFCISYVLVCQKVNGRIRYVYVVQKLSFFFITNACCGWYLSYYLFIYLFIYLLVYLFTFNKQISHNKNSEDNSPAEPSTMQSTSPHVIRHPFIVLS